MRAWLLWLWLLWLLWLWLWLLSVAAVAVAVAVAVAAGRMHRYMEKPDAFQYFQSKTHENTRFSRYPNTDPPAKSAFPKKTKKKQT